MSDHDIQIELEGLITLLAQNLYADPDVFLREMIQNAHDSIRKREAVASERGEHDLPRGEIRIGTDRDAATLAITDNGAGLTEEEIHKYLSTIGRSGTRELKEQLASHAQALSLIGQFGIGLLSAFIVADKVVVETRSSAGGSFRWTSGGGRRYHVEPADREAVGTTVTLHLRPEHDRYLNHQNLGKIIRTYADFLGLPVYLGADTEPSNAVHAPWHRTFTTREEYLRICHEYWDRHFKDEHALDLLAVDEPVRYTDPRTGKVIEGRLRGVLGITDRHVPDVNTRGTVDVYVRRMFVSAGNREVLPGWARFIQGVLECDVFTPNAARDNIIHDDALRAARERLGTLLVEHLSEMSRKSPERFQDIMRWHAYHVLGMSVMPEHEPFFRAVADIVPLLSNLGPVTLPDYLRAATGGATGPRTVYYLEERGSTTQFYMLCSARGLRVIDASEPFAGSFLQRYQEIWPERIRLVRLDVSSSETIFETPGADEARPFSPLEAAFARIVVPLGAEPRLTRFKPVEVPAVLTENQNAAMRKQMEEIAGNVVLPTGIRSVLKGYLKERRDPLTLHINIDNETIRNLAARPNLHDTVSESAIISLHNNAFMLLARTISEDNLRRIFTSHNLVIDLLIRGEQERERLERERISLLERLRAAEKPEKPVESERSPVITCFVAMPFHERHDELYEALEKVLEDLPYLWDVGRADRNDRHDPQLWENIQKQMRRAHCFIAEVSDTNPNVMIEIGRMEAFNRPVLFLRRKGASSSIADLGGRLYTEYESTGDKLVDELREKIHGSPFFAEQHGEHAITAAVFEREADVPAARVKAVMRAYRSCEALANATDLDATAQRTGVRLDTLVTLQKAARDLLTRVHPTAPPPT